MKPIALPALTAVAVCTATASAAAQDGRQAAFTDRVNAQRSELIAIRRDIHQHPEVSGQEVRTAALVARHLESLGFEVRAGIGGHGVAGILRGVSPGPIVAFRADLDAVRSDAPDAVDFRSLTPGIRHICGHDIHTTIGLALAEGFSAIRSGLAGSVMLVFQPAEENARGARAMIADNVFEPDRPDAIYAFHTAPMNVGQLATAAAALMPGRDGVRATIAGDGDLRAVAAQVRRILLSVSTVTAAEASRPADPEMLFAQIGPVRRTGENFQVSGTYTTGSPVARAFARHVLDQQLAPLSAGGVTVTLQYEEKIIAGVTNDPELVTRANAAARSVPAVEVLMLETLTPMFSEDFGAFQAQVPGVMYFLGVSNPEQGWVGMPHSPDYVADEEAIFVGAGAMAAIMLDRLGTR